MPTICFLRNPTLLGAPSRRPLRGCGFPFGLCESPTVLGRMWASAPTGFVHHHQFVLAGVVEDADPYGVCARRWDCGFCGTTQGSFPTGLHIAVRIVQNPTLLGRMWASAPTHSSKCRRTTGTVFGKPSLLSCVILFCVSISPAPRCRDFFPLNQRNARRFFDPHHCRAHT